MRHMQGRYRGVFPVKCNHDRGMIRSMLRCGAAHGWGLEVGSKAELLLAMSLLAGMPGSLLICNGYKDTQYMELVRLLSCCNWRLMHGAGHHLAVQTGLGLEGRTLVQTCYCLPVPGIYLLATVPSVDGMLWLMKGRPAPLTQGACRRQHLVRIVVDYSTISSWHAEPHMQTGGACLPWLCRWRTAGGWGWRLLSCLSNTRYASMTCASLFGCQTPCNARGTLSLSLHPSQVSQSQVAPAMMQPCQTQAQHHGSACALLTCALLVFD